MIIFLHFGQKVFSLEIKSVQPSEILDKISYKRSFTFKTERDREVQNVLFSLYDNAYLSAQVDSIVHPTPALPKGEGVLPLLCSVELFFRICL